jgi:hypothetical protein
MKHEALEKVCGKVYRSHPEVAGVNPKVTQQSEGRFLLLFKSKATTMGAKQINHTIRVVSNDQGEIIKISSSRG